MEKFNTKTYHDNKEELHGTIYQQTKKKKNEELLTCCFA